MRTHDFGPDNNNANDCSLKFGLSFVTIWRSEQGGFLRFKFIVLALAEIFQIYI